MKLYPHISIYFFIWVLIILFISFVGFLTLPHSGNFSNDFTESLGNWDGGHFLGIAEFGYSQNFQYAFFPLYPILIKIVNEIIQNYLISALLISFLSTLLGLNILYKLIQLDFDKNFAQKVILGLLFFPTSFYFLTAYSEGLFFLLVVLSFYFLRTKKLIWAVIFASFASATRLVGLVLVLAILVEVLTTSGINKKNWFVIFAPFGFFIYCWFLLNQTGDPFYFLFAETHWQRNITIPTVSFWETLKSLSQANFVTTHINSFLDLIFAILGLGFALRSFRFLPNSYSIYFLGSVLLPLFTPTLSSMPRFLLPIFPLFILLALNKNKYFNFGYQLISILLLSVFSILFINGYWVS